MPRAPAAAEREAEAVSEPPRPRHWWGGKPLLLAPAAQSSHVTGWCSWVGKPLLALVQSARAECCCWPAPDAASCCSAAGLPPQAGGRCRPRYARGIWRAGGAVLVGGGPLLRWSCGGCHRRPAAAVPLKVRIRLRSHASAGAAGGRRRNSSEHCFLLRSRPRRSPQSTGRPPLRESVPERRCSSTRRCLARTVTRRHRRDGRR